MSVIFEFNMKVAEFTYISERIGFKGLAFSYSEFKIDCPFYKTFFDQLF